MSERPIVDVVGEPLMAESRHMLQYLRERAEGLTARGILERLRTAMQEIARTISAVEEKDIRYRPFPRKWHIADVVDHVAQSQIRGAEELRHLISGRRPPGPPVYEALKSGASEWAPWSTLVQGLQDANEEMLTVIEAGARSRNADRWPAEPVACTVIVANCRLDDERVVPQIFLTDLNWRQYTLLQRLHLLDHRTQIRGLLEACMQRPALS